MNTRKQKGGVKGYSRPTKKTFSRASRKSRVKSAFKWTLPKEATPLPAFMMPNKAVISKRKTKMNRATSAFVKSFMKQMSANPVQELSKKSAISKKVVLSIQPMDREILNDVLQYIRGIVFSAECLEQKGYTHSARYSFYKAIAEFFQLILKKEVDPEIDEKANAHYEKTMKGRFSNRFTHRKAALFTQLMTNTIYILAEYKNKNLLTHINNVLSEVILEHASKEPKDAHADALITACLGGTVAHAKSVHEDEDVKELTELFGKL